MLIVVFTWPPALVVRLREQAEFVRRALDAWRQGQRFSETRELMPGRLSVTVPFVRVTWNELSYGLGIEEAAELAGVDAPVIRVPPPVEPPPRPPVLPMFERVEPAFELAVLERAGGGSARAPSREELGYGSLTGRRR